MELAVGLATTEGTALAVHAPPVKTKGEVTPAIALTLGDVKVSVAISELLTPDEAKAASIVVPSGVPAWFVMPML